MGHDSQKELPTLPLELWLLIFEIATYEPGPLELHRRNPFSLAMQPYSWPSGWLSLPTKRALIRVCRRWRALALPILYRTVIFRGNEPLRSLHHALVGDSDGLGLFQGMDRVSLRSRVRCFFCCSLNFFISDERYIAYLCDILDKLTNLEEVAIRPLDWHEKRPILVPGSVLTVLAARGGSLRSFDWWSCSTVVPNPVKWREMISQMPQLQYLRMSSSDAPPVDTGRSASPSLRFPTLSTLISLEDSPRGLCWDRDQFPSLRTLSTEEDSWNFPMGVSFGDQIIHLSLDICFSTGVTLNRFIEKALQTFPNVADLILYSRSATWDFFSPGLRLYNVERLGLNRPFKDHPRDDDNYAAEYIGLPDSFSSMQAPKLHLIGLFSQEWFKLRSERPAVWTELKEIMRASKVPVRFADSAGDFLE